jgi:hypothetical protein
MLLNRPGGGGVMTDSSASENSGASEWVRIVVIAIVFSVGLTALLAGFYFIGSALWG